MPHDFISSYSVKFQEYMIAISFLFLFIPFWRFVNGGQPAPQLAKAARRAVRSLQEFFLPDDVYLHPGHSWARRESGLVAVGVDDFAQKLVGSIQSLKLPQVGATVGQGEQAFSLIVQGQELGMLSPLDGKVVAVNEKLLEQPSALKSDPYGEGWLFKVEAQRAEANLKQLLAGDSARRWINEVWETMRSGMNPQLGIVMQDGGTPVDGLAANIDPEKWYEVARKHFLT